MNYPYYHSHQISKQDRTTDLGYRVFCCHRCCRFQERTGTAFNHLEFPVSISEMLFRHGINTLVQEQVTRYIDATNVT